MNINTIFWRGAVVLCAAIAPALWAKTFDLTVDRVTLDTGQFTRSAIGYNGSTPGPVLRFKEGDDITINVTNHLDEATSVHWHGLILPYQMDGVPDISYDGIEPGETFTYHFPTVQSGTYWFHSHSGFQEPEGAYGAIIIEPKTPEPYPFDKEYVIQLTDAHPHSGHRIMRNLKMMPDYYNRQQRDAKEFFNNIGTKGLAATLRDAADWGGMRMMPTDIEDVQGFTPLINGKSAEQNWVGLFKPGERVRLRFINSSAMTYFDIRIPGLKMTVINADGNPVHPVNVDEFRIAVAETYDVIVEPVEQAYTIFAESLSRSAFGRATLATSPELGAEIPILRSRPLLTMADMGMHHGGMDHSQHGGMNHDTAKMNHSQHGNMNHDTAKMNRSTYDEALPAVNALPPSPFYADGSGLTPAAANGGKFLSYSDLRALNPLYEFRTATREIELRLTGNMERYIWSINGVKYSDADPIVLYYGERVRFKFVNETMMTHPMHLHGMWSILDVGAGKWNPIKHTVSVAPGATLYTETEVDAEGQWAFHCHLSYHAASGMFRKIVVKGGPKKPHHHGEDN